MEYQFVSTPGRLYDVLTLKYLAYVLQREGLRYHPSLPMTLRRASTDHILPLQHPIQGLNGEILTELPISAGQLVMIDIKAFNRQTDIFGDDAEMFKPERWIGKEGILNNGSKSYLTYHPLLSFIGGPRCVMTSHLLRNPSCRGPLKG